MSDYSYVDYVFSGDAAEQKALRERLKGIGTDDVSALIEEFGGDPDDYNLDGATWAISYEDDKGGDTPVRMWVLVPWGDDDGLGDLIAEGYDTLEIGIGNRWDEEEEEEVEEADDMGTSFDDLLKSFGGGIEDADKDSKDEDDYCYVDYEFRGDAAEKKALCDRLKGIGTDDVSALIKEFGGNPDDFSLGGSWSISYEEDGGGDTPVKMWVQVPWGELTDLGELFERGCAPLELWTAGAFDKDSDPEEAKKREEEKKKDNKTPIS